MQSKPRKRFPGLLAAMALLLGGSLTLPAQTSGLCSLEMPPAPSNAVAFTMSAPWAITGDYSPSNNPSYIAIQTTTGILPVPIGSYLGWCVDEATDMLPNPTAYDTLLYAGEDPNLNAQLPQGRPATVYVTPDVWHQVNYLLNHKNGAYFWDVQLAIWSLVGGPVPAYSYMGTPYPDGHPDVVNLLVADAQANATNWFIHCGDTVAVVAVVQNWATPIQIVILEVPCRCATPTPGVPCLSVAKSVACLQPNDTCGTFDKVATGVQGLEAPAFCYQITVLNCGTIALTNVSVIDDHLGDVSRNFFPDPNAQFAPGDSLTRYYKLASAANTTNSVFVLGHTPGDTGTTSASDSAVALVNSASLNCTVTLTSSCDLDGSTNDNHVLLPGCGAPCAVAVNVQVCNTGQAGLTGVTLVSPSLVAMGCALPVPFDLPVGACVTVQCATNLTCPGGPLVLDVLATGTIASTLGQCANNTNGSPIGVAAAATGTIECSPNGGASLCGSVLRDCNADGDLTGESGLGGISVLLKDTNGVPVATTASDTTGAYCFNNLTGGTYFVSVVVPTDYRLTTGVVTNRWTDGSGQQCWQDGQGHTHWTDSGGQHHWSCGDGSQHYQDHDGKQFCQETSGKFRLTWRFCDRDSRDDSAGKTCWQDSSGTSHWQDDQGRDCWKDTTGCVHRKDTSGNECWQDRDGNHHWRDCDGKHYWTDRRGKRYCDDGNGGSKEDEDKDDRDCGSSTGVSNERLVTVATCETATGNDFGLTGTAPGVSLIKVGPATANCGDVITLTYLVTNTGNTCLYGGLTVSDPLFGGQFFHQTPVVPGQGFVIQTNYALTRATPPVLLTTATAVGHPPTGNPVSVDATWAVQVTPCPPPPTPAIAVDKTIACLLPNNGCGDFGKTATAYHGVEDPAFCFRIAVSNAGPVTLTNLSVVDDQLDDVTTNFFADPTVSLAPGAAVTTYFKMTADGESAGNIVVSGQSVEDGSIATNSDTATAQVSPALVACQLLVTSPDDRDGNTNNNVVMLPSDGAPHVVTFSVTVTNPGSASLANVTLIAPSLANFVATLPAPFPLAAGASRSFNLCTTAVTCPNVPLNNPVTVVAMVDTAVSPGCANDLDGNAILVQSQCSAQVGCTNVSSGCTFNTGYYRNHPGAIAPLPISLGTPGGIKTLVITNGSLGIAVLSENRCGTPANDLTSVYAELLAAKINLLHGADGTVVASTIAQADAFLASHTDADWCRLSRTDQQSVTAWKVTLNAYNNGQIGPGHCAAPCSPRKETIESDFNSQLPRGAAWLWLSANISTRPNKEATVYCRNAKVTITGRSGRKYGYAVPDGTIFFSSAVSSATCTNDNGEWKTTVPIQGDDEIFLAGVSIPAQDDFRRATSVIWEGEFTSDTAGLGLSWRWSGAAYTADLSDTSSLGVKASHSNACPSGRDFRESDHAGTPCNVKRSVGPGCRGGGGSNYTGSWSGTDSLKLCNQSTGASNWDR